jgi:hypothetical protein
MLVMAMCTSLAPRRLDKITCEHYFRSKEYKNKMLYAVKLGEDITYFSHYRVGVSLINKLKDRLKIDATREVRVHRQGVILYFKFYNL